jgi:hypothetical protein
MLKMLKKQLPGAIKISFFFDLSLRKVMSLVGSRSRRADLACKKAGFRFTKA